MSYLLTGARWATQRTLGRAVLAGSVFVSAGSCLLAPAARLDAASGVIGASRWWEAGVLAVAVIAAMGGAESSSGGLVRRWWTAGASRREALVWGMARSVGAAVSVAGTWAAAAAGAVLLRRGVPDPGPWPDLAETLLRSAVVVLAVAAVAHLIGSVLGRPAIAALVVVVSTVPFTSERLDVLPAPPAWTVVCSPTAAARALAAGGVGDALGAASFGHATLAQVVIAVVAWIVVLGHRASTRSLVPDPSRRGRGRRWAPAVAIVGVGAMALLAPEPMARLVPWTLRPTWRDQTAHGRSATQVTARWLRCRARGSGCARWEIEGGAEVGEGGDRVLRGQTDVEVLPDPDQSAPDAVDALISSAPRTSGEVDVVGAAVRVLLVRVDGRWRVARLLGPTAVVES